MPVEILIDENGTINAVVSAQQVAVEIIASMIHQGDTIKLDGLHLERLSAEQLGHKEIELLCAEFCGHFKARKLIVQGARRTTGRSAGSIPRAIHYEAAK